MSSKEKVIVIHEDGNGEYKETIKSGMLISLPRLDGPGVKATMLIDGDETPVAVDKLGKEKIWRHTRPA